MVKGAKYDESQPVGFGILCHDITTHMPNSLSKVEQTVQIPFHPKHQTHLLLSMSSSFVSGQSCLHFVVKENANVN